MENMMHRRDRSVRKNFRGEIGVSENEMIIHAHVAVRLGKSVLLFSGSYQPVAHIEQGNDLCHRMIYRYSLDSEKWYIHEIPDTQVAPPPTVYACAAAVGSAVYKFGGVIHGGLLTNALWKLTEGKDNFEWLEIQSSDNEAMPSPRRQACAWDYDGKFWAFGGRGTNPYGYLIGDEEWVREREDQFICNQLISFEPGVRAWNNVQSVGDIPQPRCGHATTKVDNVLYLFGGIVDGFISSDLYRLHMPTLTWTLIQTALQPNGPLGRLSHSFTALGSNHLIVHGGFTTTPSNTKPLSDTWSFNLTSQRWTEYSVDNHNRYNHTGIQGNNCVIIAGGHQVDADGFHHKCSDVLYFNVFYEPRGLEDLALRAVHKNLQQLDPREVDMPEEIFQRLVEM